MTQCLAQRLRLNDLRRGKALHILDFYKIGFSRASGGISARYDYFVSVLKIKSCGGNFFCGIEEDVGGGELLAHSGDNAPGERKLAPGSLVGGETYNVNGRAEA